MKGVVIFLNIFLSAFVLFEGMRRLGWHTLSDFPLVILAMVCLSSVCVLVMGQPILKRPFVKKALITLNLLAAIFAVVGLILHAEEGMKESYLLVLALISLCNVYVFLTQKQDWSDKLLKHRFFTRNRLLRAVVLPVTLLTILSISLYPSGYRIFLSSLKNYLYFQYDPDWTGIHILHIDDPQVSHPFAFVQRGFKSKEACVEGGQIDYGFINNQNSTYVCGKKCFYNDFGYGFCLQRD